MKLFLLPLLFFIGCIINVAGQTDSAKSPFTVSAYGEFFYAYNIDNPGDHKMESFMYSFNRHNTFSLNLGVIKASYNTDNVRGNIAFMAGTYSNDNMTSEPGVLKNIYEANGGFKISKNKNVWVDVGIMPSHIGWESAIGKDNINLTRSIAADNSPYYETGLRLSYTSANGKWYIAGLILNGWQRIERVPGNNTPAFGHQITYKPNASVTINSSSFIGNDKPDSIKQMRYFHDLYGQFQITNNFALTLGFDIGAEQKAKGSSSFNTWYTPVIIASVLLNDKWKIGLRGEYYSDKNSVVIATGTPNGFQTFGYSANIDCNITNNVLWRLEARGLNSKDKVFNLNKNPVNNSLFFISSLDISF